MRLLRLKITDMAGFRSLPPGFEHHFRTEIALQEERTKANGFEPILCAGPNGSGKSNLLEVLAAIFFQLELLRVRRSFLPETFLHDEVHQLEGSERTDHHPDAFELEYLIKVPPEFRNQENSVYAHVRITKTEKTSPEISWLNSQDFDVRDDGAITESVRDFLLPQYVLGYSSGENEILSLPFFKMRFVQFDEYWNCLREQLSYPGRPETRLAYLDNGFSQAILLCNLLFEDVATLKPFRDDVGIDALKEFRIIIKRRIAVSAEVADTFGADHPALIVDPESGEPAINLMQLLEAGPDSAPNFDPIVNRLKRCATCWFVDEENDSLVLDYWINPATRQAFSENFDQSPLALFQAFQVLLTLNLYAVSDTTKADLYRSNSHYVSETVPTLASDERIMRFKFVRFTKQGVLHPMMLKELSDGEHQLLHSLGLCLLFRNTNSLFLLDEPETHFNPDWRSNFISRLRQCLSSDDSAVSGQEMVITTHTPFLISDSRPEKVLIFNRDTATGKVAISLPDYNTLGASINKITMNTFGKRDTIGGYAKSILDGLRNRFERGEDKERLITEIDQQLGDSVEKLLLIKVILDSMEVQS